MASVKKIIQNEFGEWQSYIDDGWGALIHVLWAPFSGSQEVFLAAPEVEVCYGSGRGVGKTNALFMSFGQHCGKGWGAAWRGVIFRRTLGALDELVRQSQELLPKAFPGIEWHVIRKEWRWPTGETLRFAQFEGPAEYAKWHGQSFPFIGWDELTTWPTDECLNLMYGCLRSVVPNMPRMVRCTTNPSGVGHNWVKLRYGLPLAGFPHQIIGPAILDAKDTKGMIQPSRRYIGGRIEENLLLMQADPDYVSRLSSTAVSDAQYQAYRFGSWDITSGGLLDGIWPELRPHCIVKPFRLPPTWRASYAYDHGSSKPFSFGVYGESDGTDLLFNDGTSMSTRPGDLFRMHEWYGWSGVANKGLPHMPVDEIARGMVERLKRWGLSKRCRLGVADNSIFDEINGYCTNDVFLRYGIHFEAAAKGPHSRVEGWTQFVMRLKATIPDETGYRENPGFYIVGENCPQFLRTVVTLPRDENNPDDVDTESEDHVGDEIRYRLRWHAVRMRSYAIGTVVRRDGVREVDKRPPRRRVV